MNPEMNGKKSYPPYLIVNPNPTSAHGISAYIDSLRKALPIGIEVHSLVNDKKLLYQDFREFVRQHVTTRYGVDEVFIEAPESRASTLLLPKDYRVHIRLHCPFAIAQKYDGVRQDQQAYSEELRAINKAAVVSSPSFALLRELRDEINVGKCFVFKNPCDLDIEAAEFTDKDIDVIFMGRFQRLKGVEYINSILELLPSHYSVLLLGLRATSFKISPKVQCVVRRKEHISGEERFDLLRRSKTLMLLSKFENCSMVLLEALSAKVVVIGWKVGGTPEVAGPPVLKIVPFENTDRFAAEIVAIVDGASKYPGAKDFDAAVSLVNVDFKSGFREVLARLDSAEDDGQWSSRHPLDCSPLHIFNESVQKISDKLGESRSLDDKPFGKRVLGFTISNEHIEEMWAPVVDVLGLDYRYICRRPIGTHSCFGYSYPVMPEYYAVYDWIKHEDRLIYNILSYRPNKILFHNGSHPAYQKVLERVKALGIPIVYSELGWFPQKGNIYFDRWGVGGKSYLASLSAHELCGKHLGEDESSSVLASGFVLLVTQLENDTNILVHSPRFKSNLAFVRHVISEVPSGEKIVVKPHPLDASWRSWVGVLDARCTVVTDEPVEKLLSEAKAVVGINSTVLVQALEYDVNIYAFGRSVLDNKGIVINCIDGSLGGQWTDEMKGSRRWRDELVEALKKRQVSLSKLTTLNKQQLLAHRGLEPLLMSNIEDFSNLPAINSISLSESVNSNSRLSDFRVSHGGITALSLHGRRFRKLCRSPKRYLLDSKHKILRMLGRVL